MFRDVVAIRPGVDWQQRIEEAIRASDLCICVMGPRWLELLQARQASGDPDIVVAEIKAALDRELAPIAVGGGRPPRPTDLPDEIRDLPKRHVISLRDDHWHDDLRPLLDQVHALWDDKRDHWPPSLKKLTGNQIVERAWSLMNPPLQMGRRGGLRGQDMTRDLDEGLWSSQLYEVFYDDRPVSSPWFLVSDFIAELERRGQYPPPA